MMDNHQDPHKPHPATSQVAYYNSVFKHAMLLAANQTAAFHPHPSAHTLWVNFLAASYHNTAVMRRDTCKTICLLVETGKKPCCALASLGPASWILGGDFIMNARCRDPLKTKWTADISNISCERHRERAQDDWHATYSFMPRSCHSPERQKRFLERGGTEGSWALIDCSNF